MGWFLYRRPVSSATGAIHSKSFPFSKMRDKYLFWKSLGEILSGTVRGLFEKQDETTYFRILVVPCNFPVSVVARIERDSGAAGQGRGVANPKSSRRGQNRKVGDSANKSSMNSVLCENSRSLTFVRADQTCAPGKNPNLACIKTGNGCLEPRLKLNKSVAYNESFAQFITIVSLTSLSQFLIVQGLGKPRDGAFFHAG